MEYWSYPSNEWGRFRRSWKGIILKMLTTSKAAFPQLKGFNQIMLKLSILPCRKSSAIQVQAWFFQLPKRTHNNRLNLVIHRKKIAISYNINWYHVEKLTLIITDSSELKTEVNEIWFWLISHFSLPRWQRKISWANLQK